MYQSAVFPEAGNHPGHTKAETAVRGADRRVELPAQENRGLRLRLGEPAILLPALALLGKRAWYAPRWLRRPRHRDSVPSGT